jgi:hypothetical protein
MENIDYEDRPLARYRSDRSAILWNILTGTVLIAVLAVVVVFLTILINPQSGMNPFPPNTLPPALAFPTATPTPLHQLPPTWTPTVTLQPTATNTPRPTATLPPTQTPFSLVEPSPGPPTATSGGMPFVVQEGHPVAISNIYHPEKGCNWIGIGGQVFDMKNSAISGQQVLLGGVLNGEPIPQGSRPTLTGLVPYVPGYYEFDLGEETFASKGRLWVQLVDQASLPMSDKVYFDTYDDCEKNQVIINFKQVR